MQRRDGCTRRRLLTLAGVSCLLPARALAFGQAGAFHPRILLTGRARWDGPRARAPERWSFELERRTSAPGRATVREVRAEDSALLDEPFCMWAGKGEIEPLSGRELGHLTQYLSLGGMIVVDDFDPDAGVFGRAVRRELRRVLPETPAVRLDASHVLYKTYYIIDRPVGRVLGSASLEAIVRGKNAQVLFLNHDLLGALARDDAGWAFDVQPRGAVQREHAVRLAVNIAMYLLCSDYKDDQVHAPWLMRRRAAR